MIPTLLRHVFAPAQRMGLCVRAGAVHGVHVQWREVLWAGSAAWASNDELTEVIARLAGECVPPPKRVCVALARDVVQVRSILPPPPLKQRHLRRYVELEVARLFRKNGTPLVCDATLAEAPDGKRALYTAAAEEPVVRAILQGCSQAGMLVGSIGPSADVVTAAVAKLDPGELMAFGVADGAEQLEIAAGRVWRSRLVRPATTVPEVTWVDAIARYGAEAARFAPAYGAAIGHMRLDLTPADVRNSHSRQSGRVSLRFALMGLALWVLATGTCFARQAATLEAVSSELGAMAPLLDEAVRLRRELTAASSALDAVGAAERSRSRHLTLFADLTAALSDSSMLVAIRVSANGTVQLAGYAPRAADVLAAVEQIPSLAGSRFEGSVTRETVSWRRGALDRFAIMARQR